ncbi:hypothetical protein [Deinococcus sp. Marseille-Q6407]|uniref:hypothetical protein n=1 Tax=Deinococcus sp. Marseille-Q6407 TaxID=2969223 RepID=UPI0021BECF2E|nr:hypothetical protein [Deinococcus sp. Marseille-Q6407]
MSKAPFQPPEGFGELVKVCRAALQRQALLADMDEDSAEAAVMRSELADHDRQVQDFAARLAEDDPQGVLTQARLLAAEPRQRQLPQSTHCAVCPVRGCGRELPIKPEHADRAYRCPCPNAAELYVGRTDKAWTLHLPPSTQEQRETVNRIAHALYTGQGYRDRGHRPTLTAADGNSARMAEAFQTFHALTRQVTHAVLAGHPMQALDLAERAYAAEAAYWTHERRYRLARREHQNTGRWHDTETFWIEQPDPYTPGHPLRRYTFNLVAVWDERGATVEVVNGREIEVQSGLAVDAEAWRQLVALLTRAESKPGSKTDPQELVYRSHKGSLVVRDHVKKRFPEALKALEALRLSLVMEARAPQ